MDEKSSKQFISSFFKERGLRATARKRVFVQDCEFYLIVAEIQPAVGKEGILLNVGVKFLWSNYYEISYDYSSGDCRINVPNDPLGALFWDNPNAELILDRLLNDGMDQIIEYRKLQDFDTFLYKIKNRNDFVQRANANFEKIDESLAIGKMFNGEFQEALTILQAASPKNEVALKLLENCNDIELFKCTLINIINNCRSAMAKKLKISLEPIDSIWNF